MSSIQPKSPEMPRARIPKCASTPSLSASLPQEESSSSVQDNSRRARRSLSMSDAATPQYNSPVASPFPETSSRREVSLPRSDNSLNNNEGERSSSQPHPSSAAGRATVPSRWKPGVAGIRRQSKPTALLEVTPDKNQIESLTPTTTTRSASTPLMNPSSTSVFRESSKDSTVSTLASGGSPPMLSDCLWPASSSFMRMPVDWTDGSTPTKEDPMPWLTKKKQETEEVFARSISQSSKPPGGGVARSTSQLSSSGRKRQDALTAFGRSLANADHKTVEERLGLKPPKKKDANVDPSRKLELFPLPVNMGEAGAITLRQQEDAYYGGEPYSGEDEEEDRLRGRDEEYFFLAQQWQPQNRLPLRKVMTPRNQHQLRELEEGLGESDLFDKEAHGVEGSPRPSLQSILAKGGVVSARKIENQGYGGRRSPLRSPLDGGGGSSPRRAAKRSQSLSSILKMKRIIRPDEYRSLSQRDFELEMEIENLRVDLNHAYGALYVAEKHMAQLAALAENGLEEQGNLVVDLVAEAIANAAKKTKLKIKEAAARNSSSTKASLPLSNSLPPATSSSSSHELEEKGDNEGGNVEVFTSPLTRKERIQEAARRAQATGLTLGEILWGSKETDYVAVVLGILFLLLLFGAVLFLSVEFYSTMNV